MFADFPLCSDTVVELSRSAPRYLPLGGSNKVFGGGPLEFTVQGLAFPSGGERLSNNRL
jgi:hypothetical protein